MVGLISEYDLILQEGPEERPPLPFAGIAETPILPQEAAAPPPPPAIADADAKARRMAETATIRLSDLRTEQVEVPPQEVPEGQRAKLVGISGRHRGEELLLDRSPIRLGRSEENDLRIEHPSISRKHLRLHLDNGTWKVMDAESRNGVRVNGEPYAQIGLRHGDVVEVGHLRYAFVERGRPFHLPPELTPLAPSMLASPPARTGLWVGIGMASVVLLAVSIFLILRDRAEAEIAQRLRAQRESALRSADESAAAHRYSEALQGLDTARRLGAAASDLKAYDAVEREARGEDLYRDMEGAVAAQDWDRARRLFDALSATQTSYGVRTTQAVSLRRSSGWRRIRKARRRARWPTPASTVRCRRLPRLPTAKPALPPRVPPHKMCPARTTRLRHSGSSTKETRSSSGRISRGRSFSTRRR